MAGLGGATEMTMVGQRHQISLLARIQAADDLADRRAAPAHVACLHG
jgi:hypothetical protein